MTQLLAHDYSPDEIRHLLAAAKTLRLDDNPDLRRLFSTILVHSVDFTILQSDAPQHPSGYPDRYKVHTLDIRASNKVLPGWAKLVGSTGDEWKFRWDPRWRCGGCGTVIENGEGQDPAGNLVPYCPKCTKVLRPGMYTVDEARG